MTDAAGFLELHGLDSWDNLDVEALWRTRDLGADFRVPIGFDQSGSPAFLDFSRWTSLDDHVLVVGAPRAGTTTLLRTIALSLCMIQSPDFVNIFMIEGRADALEYQQLATGIPHNRGHVTVAHGNEERIAYRLAQTLIGVVERRQERLRSAAAASIEDYRNNFKNTDATPNDLAELAELLVIIDNLEWLHGKHFDQAVRLLAEQGHAVGVRMVVGVPYRLWEALGPTGYLDCFTARIALGLSQEQASEVLGTPVPGGLTSPGDAYIRWLGGEPTRVKVATTDVPARTSRSQQ